MGPKTSQDSHFTGVLFKKFKLFFLLEVSCQKHKHAQSVLHENKGI